MALAKFSSSCSVGSAVLVSRPAIVDAEDIGQSKVVSRRAELIEQRRIQTCDQSAAVGDEFAYRSHLPIIEAGGVRQDQHLVSRTGLPGSDSSR